MIVASGAPATRDSYLPEGATRVRACACACVCACASVCVRVQLVRHMWNRLDVFTIRLCVVRGCVARAFDSAAHTIGTSTSCTHRIASFSSITCPNLCRPPTACAAYSKV